MSKRKINLLKTIKIFFNYLIFKLINLPFYYKIVIIGSIIGIISLFFPWIIDSKSNKSWNSFNNISGNIGYILIFAYLINIFVVISNNLKEKLKLYSDIIIKNHIIVLVSSIIAISFSIISISFSIGMSTLSENIIYGNGPILSMMSGIIILIGGIIIRKEYKKISSEIILEQLSENRKKTKESDNMSLPI